jgi:hypothetical protein
VIIYQLPNGKTVYLSVEEFLSLTDQDIQYLISVDCGESILNPFKNSTVDSGQSQKEYDFEYLNMEEYEESGHLPHDTIIDSDDDLFDEIIDLPENPID